jgi:hypothetical protein
MSSDPASVHPAARIKASAAPSRRAELYREWIIDRVWFVLRVEPAR